MLMVSGSFTSVHGNSHLVLVWGHFNHLCDFRTPEYHCWSDDNEEWLGSYICQMNYCRRIELYPTGAAYAVYQGNKHMLQISRYEKWGRNECPTKNLPLERFLKYYQYSRLSTGSFSVLLKPHILMHKIKLSIQNLKSVVNVSCLCILAA